MMIGERTHGNPTVHVPPWCTLPDDPTADDAFIISPTGNDPSSPCFNISSDDYNSLLQNEALRALHRYLPSNNLPDVGEDEEFGDEDGDLPVDLYSCDHFRMFEFKVRKCMRSRSHDWTDCPFAHPGEKARRRDPRKYHYSGSACPEFRKGSCRKGDSCEFAHGVFECWLHPARYRTQPCKDGLNCMRRVCFFAHSTDQLRILSPRSDSYDGSPKRLLFEGPFGKSLHFMSSPESGSPPTESPPMSPITNSHSVPEIVASLRQLQLNKVKTTIPSAWGFQLGGSGAGSSRLNMTQPGFISLPATPTLAVTHPGLGYFDAWEKNGCQEEPVMERVESGRDLRAKIFEKLSKENPLNMVDPNSGDASGPDVGWVSELVK